MTITEIADFQQPTIIETLMVQAQPVKKEPLRHKVKKNETLSSIAKKYKTTWVRLWQKNMSLINQDMLAVGQVLTIPSADETLADRPLYKVILPVKYRATQNVPSNTSSNLYTYRSCTWWVKNNRPDIPNSWGNAYEWLYNARSQGYAIGSTPKAGAVGWVGNHVVYVMAVKGDKVLVGDGNYDWNGSYKEHWVDSSTYTYIY